MTKVTKLAARLGKSRRETVGLLLDFFVWVRSYAETGFLAEWSNDDVCLALGIDGTDFFGALQETKWIKDGWIKNWHVFGGAEVAEKAKRDPVVYSEMIDFYSIIPYGENPVKKREKTGLEEKRKEEKRKERPKTPTAYSEAFEVFWTSYPARKGKKQGKKRAWGIWHKLNPTGALLTKIMAGAAAIKNEEYPKDAERWLKAEGWNDDLQASNGCQHDYRKMSLGFKDGEMQFQLKCFLCGVTK